MSCISTACRKFRASPQLNGHVMLQRDRYVPLEPIDKWHEDEHLIYLAYDEANL